MNPRQDQDQQQLLGRWSLACDEKEAMFGPMVTAVQYELLNCRTFIVLFITIKNYIIYYFYALFFLLE